MFDFRVSHEEESANKKSNATEDFNLDEDLYRTEGIWTDITLRIGDNDRLFYIYTLTGIILSTIIITLARSFIFFSASISRVQCTCTYKQLEPRLEYVRHSK